MAASKNLLLCQPLLLVFLFFFALLPHPSHAHILKTCGFNAIYQLGDSISDTGNLIRENPSSLFARLPYGETTFKNATGRCSNGLLMIDYIAMSSGLPLLKPYLNMDAPPLQRPGHGVNFAVAGSTALPVEVLAANGVMALATNSSLSVQLNWLSALFNRTCTNDNDCFQRHKKALFMVGEIGGNDYNYALFQGKTLDEARAMVPKVVQAIKDAATRVIDYGATRVVIPGNFPIGCLPIYLTGFQTNNTAAYDELHCLKDLNNLAIYHNYHLKQAIAQLRTEHPNVIMVYADYYNAFRWLLSRVKLLRFDAAAAQKVCCGTGGDYNFNLMKLCGAPGVPVCPKPGRYLSWDGIHLTQRAYSLMTSWLLRHIYPNLRCRFA